MSADTSSVTAAASSADSGNQSSKKNEPVAKVDAHFKNTVFLSTILADIPGKLEVSKLLTLEFTFRLSPLLLFLSQIYAGKNDMIGYVSIS